MAVNASSLTLELEQILQTQYTAQVYPTFYDNADCLAENVTYSNRVDQPGSFAYCAVPLSAADCFLFAGIAVLLAALLANKLSAVWLLLAGGALGVVNYYANLLRLSNAIALWLQIQPPYLFWYAFLPPLLVDAAMRLDFYTFSKVWVNVVLLAFPLVIISVLALAPFVLFALGFQSRGWDWVHGALLAAVLAPTDAVSVTAILKAGGGPEFMSVLMEGEALLNDATAITFYEIFFRLIDEYRGQDAPTVWSQIPDMLLTIVRLAGVGVGVGLVAGLATTPLLRWMRWRGLAAVAEVCLTLAVAYLAFYVAQGPAGGSGVFAVVTYGIFSSATSRFGMLSNDAGSAVHETVWDTVAFIANGLVFFWSGISSINLIIRSAGVLHTAWSYAAIPIIFLFSFLQRGLTILAFNPLHKLSHVGEVLTLGQMVFATWGGLRGSLSLIMVSSLTVQSSLYSSGSTEDVDAEILLWTSVFVLLTLCLNAPTLGPLMAWLGLNRGTEDQARDKRYALRRLRQYTREAAVRLEGQADEFLLGADWRVVLAYVQHRRSDPRKAMRPSAPPPTALTAAALRSLSAAAPGPAAAAAPQPAAGESPTSAAGASDAAAARQWPLHTTLRMVMRRLTAPKDEGGKALSGVEGAPPADGASGSAQLDGSIAGSYAPAPPPSASVSVSDFSMEFPRLEDLMSDEEGGTRHGDAFTQALQTKAEMQLVAWRTRLPSADGGAAYDSSDDEGLQPRVDQPLPHLRLRVIHIVERYVEAKRLQALLSSSALQALHFACERAAEHMQAHPTSPFDLWSFVEREAEESRVRRAVGWVAAKLSRLWPPLGRPLRRHLARRRLLFCEVALELYMGLACSRHMEWLYTSQEGDPGSLALCTLRREVVACLDQARTFMALREAEGPQEWVAVQTFRAAQALLHLQADFLRKQHGRGLLTDQDLEDMEQAVGRKQNRLEVIGPVWTLPPDLPLP